MYSTLVFVFGLIPALFIFLFAVVIGYMLRNAECMVRQIIYEGKDDELEGSAEKQARDRRLGTFIFISLGVFTLGLFAKILSVLLSIEFLQLETWQRALFILAALLVGRFYYDFKVKRWLKTLTPEQREQELRCGPAVLSKIHDGPDAAGTQGELPASSNSFSYPLFYMGVSIFLLIGLYLLYSTFV